MSRYVSLVRMLITKLILLIAVLAMPLGMTPATASTAHQTMAMGMPMGHCPEQTPANHLKTGFAECTMGCAAALPATLASMADTPLAPIELPRFSAIHRLDGLHPETATPPPRFS